MALNSYLIKSIYLETKQFTIVGVGRN